MQHARRLRGVDQQHDADARGTRAQSASTSVRKPGANVTVDTVTTRVPRSIELDDVVDSECGRRAA
jgi:hypothetical protein